MEPGETVGVVKLDEVRAERAAGGGPPVAGAPAKPRKKGKSKADAKFDVWMAFLAAMRGTIGAPAKFERRFAVLADGRGKRRPVEILEGDVVLDIDREAIETEILRFSHMTLASRPAFKIETKDAKEIYRIWLALEDPLDERTIAPVRQLSEKGYTWRRLPWDFASVAGVETPTFDEMMGRTSNALALMAFIGSLFDPKSGRQQYVYLHGQGGNGKGRLAAFLRKVFGGAFRSESFQGKPNNFWTSGLIGARLVCFPDFEAFDFPNSGFFKMLTGDDAVRIEQKNRDSFTADLCCKFLFLGNDAPGLNESPANRRRAIYCHIEPVAGVLESAASYEARLWDEAASWLGKCWKAWTEVSESGFIPVEAESLSGIIDSHEEPFLDLMERWFEFGKGGEGGEVSPLHMQEILRREGIKSPFEQRKFFAFLVRRFGVKRSRMREGTLRRWAYDGLVVRPEGVSALGKL